MEFLWTLANCCDGGHPKFKTSCSFCTKTSSHGEKHDNTGDTNVFTAWVAYSVV